MGPSLAEEVMVSGLSSREDREGICMQTWTSPSIRKLLKTLHTFCASAWIGGGFAVLVMLYNDRHTTNGDELFAYNYAIRTIDDYLIAPAAAGSVLSGMLLCIVTKRGLFRHRWIMVKWGVTLAAIVFGVVWLAPQLKALSEIAGLDRLAVFDNGGYFRSYRYAVLWGTLQTLVLLFLVLLSIFRPGAGVAKGESVSASKPDAVLSRGALQKRFYAFLRTGWIAGLRG
jgi:hypothetical protein